MDVVVGVLLVLVAVAVAAVQWQLLVRPEALLGLWRDDVSPRWWEVHPGALRVLRVSAGSTLFLIGLVTGIALAVIAATK
jgi:hypothetical protein